MQFRPFIGCLSTVCALMGATLAVALAQTPTTDVQTGANSHRSRPYLDMGMIMTPLTVSAKTDKKVYKAGEPIQITITFKTNSHAPTMIQFSSGQKYDLLIQRSVGKITQKVWNWADGQMFMMALTYLKVLPDKPAVFTETFDTTQEKLPALTPGAYTVTATAHLMGRTPRPSGITNFTVK